MPSRPMTMPMSILGRMMPQLSGIQMDSHAMRATGIPYQAASACQSGSEHSTYIQETISAANRARREQTITVTMAKRVDFLPPSSL